MTAAWLATDEGLMVALSAVVLFAVIGWSYLEDRNAARASARKEVR